MLLQFDLKHIHKVNFYPSDNNFTQALLVLLVTNMISATDVHSFMAFSQCCSLLLNFAQLYFASSLSTCANLYLVSLKCSSHQFVQIHSNDCQDPDSGKREETDKQQMTE